MRREHIRNTDQRVHMHGGGLFRLTAIRPVQQHAPTGIHFSQLGTGRGPKSRIGLICDGVYSCKYLCGPIPLDVALESDTC